MKELLDKYRDYLLKTVGDKECDPQGILSLMTDEGYFSDIDYESQDRASWAPSYHVDRLCKLSARAALGGVEMPTVIKLLDSWLDLDPQCSNWWYNMIGVPTKLSECALIIWDELDISRKALVLSRISRGVIFQDYRNQKETGANLLWFAATTMRYALLAEDPSLLRLAVKMAAGETEYKTEGIQPDGSFFQHGRLLYSCGYGRSFINSLALMIYITDGSAFAFPKESIGRFMEHVDGVRHMMHKGYVDIATVGREYVREGALKDLSLKDDIRLLLGCSDISEKETLRAIYDSITNKTPAFSGVRYFPSAAYLSVETGGVFISFSGMTPTLLGSELINSENFLGYNLSYGTHTTVMTTGSEYDFIAPVWDYGLIPGTSAPYLTEEELMKMNFTGRLLDEIDDYGGYSEGNVGCVYVTTKHEGTSATVAAFASPFGMIILGNSLSDKEGREMITTVEQCLVTGEVKMGDTELVHGDARYTLLSDGQFFVTRNELRRGNLRKNRMSNPDREVEERVLTVTLDRGGKNSYAYVISPASTDISGITVISNDGEDQSVRLPDGRILVARK